MSLNPPTTMFRLHSIAALCLVLLIVPSTGFPSEEGALAEAEAEADALARNSSMQDPGSASVEVEPAAVDVEKVPRLHNVSPGLDGATGEVSTESTGAPSPPRTPELQTQINRALNAKLDSVDPNRVRFRSGLTVDLDAGFDPSVMERLSSARSYVTDGGYCLIQFSYPFPTEARKQLEDAGVVFYDQAGVSALYASVPPGAVEAVQSLLAVGPVRSVGEIPPQAKIDPELAARAESQPTQRHEVIVLTFETVGAAELEQLQSVLEIDRRSDGPVHIFEGRASGDAVMELTHHRWVRWIELQPVNTLGNLEGSMGIGSDVLRSFALGGTGVDVMVVDTGIARSGTTYHPDLPSGRIVDQYDYQNTDTNASDDDSHGTHVAGSIGGSYNSGDLNSQRSWQGVTPDVDLLIYKLCCGSSQFSSVWFQQSLDRATSGGRTAHVSNNSWGGSNGSYNTNSEIADRAVRGEYNSHPIHMVVISHNDNDLSRAPGTAKNVITVGSVKDGNYPNVPFTFCTSDEYNWSPGQRVCYSNYGPLDTDGDSHPRVKPDLMAPGAMILSPVPWYDPPGDGGYYDFKHGTSMAAPHVSGTVAQILDAYSDSAPWFFDWPSTVKAMLLASAVDVGGNTDLYGRGLVDPFHSIYYQVGVNAPMAVWGNSVATTGEEKDFSFMVPAGAEEVIVVLTWADPAGANEVDNDLDILRVTDGAGVNRGASRSLDDPVEYLRITGPFTTGTWTATVEAFSLASAQSFGLAAHPILASSDLTVSTEAPGFLRPGYYFYFHQYLANSGYTAGGSYVWLDVPMGFEVIGARVYTEDGHSHWYDESELYHPDGWSTWRVAVGETLAWYDRHVRWYIRAAPNLQDGSYSFSSNAYWRVEGSLRAAGYVSNTIHVGLFGDGFESGNTTNWSSAIP